MRSIAATLPTLLVCAGLLSAGGAQAGTTLSPKVIQLAGSFQNSTAKLGDKSLTGQAGGIYGIGGSEPHAKYFNSRMRKLQRCCAASK